MEERKQEKMDKQEMGLTFYITRRKMKAALEGLVYRVCQLFPINQKKVVMWTFEGGGGYGCSPKYVAEEILKRNREGRTEYTIYWIIKDTEKEMPEEIKKVRDTLWNRAYHLSTAGTWVGNTRTFYGTKKRKKQRYIQTWHATICIKPIGKYRGKRFPKMAYLVSQYDSNMIDYVLSGSRWCTQMYREGLLYKGKIIETGTPRCDVLFNEREKKRKQIREENGIPQEGKLLVYAPTFRGGSQGGKRRVSKEEATVDFDGLIEAMEKRFGGEWYVLLRLHPQLAAKMENQRVEKRSGSRLIDVSQRADMNEILAGADAFLTDYSSAIFEAAILEMPSFIYADDLEEYIEDRGELFFEIEKLPFKAASDNRGLVKNILEFDEREYKRKLEEFKKATGVMEDGHASERVVDLIEGKY